MREGLTPNIKKDKKKEFQKYHKMFHKDNSHIKKHV